jgi:hypothetical protein
MLAELQTDSGVLSFPTRTLRLQVHVYPLGTFTGDWGDVRYLMEAHPMRGTTYELAFNNYQHWTTTAHFPRGLLRFEAWTQIPCY